MSFLSRFNKNPYADTMLAAQKRAEELRIKQEEESKAKTEAIKTLGIASQSRQSVSMIPTPSTGKPPRSPPTRKGGKKRKSKSKKTLRRSKK